MKYAISKTTRLGNRTSNEDRVASAERDHALLLVAADGMGGRAAGKQAAETLAQVMTEQFAKAKLPIKDPERFLCMLIDQAHNEIVTKVSRRFAGVKTHTTCVVCLVQDGFAWWAHVGDSRLYLFRFGTPVFRTRDHTLVEELYRSGKISDRELHTHPKRNLVTQCIGAPTRPPSPSFGGGMALQLGDVVLLCTDGLWGALREDMLGEFFTLPDVGAALEQAAHQAESRSYPQSDNISGVALRWESNAAIVDAAMANAAPAAQPDIEDFSKSLASINEAIAELEKGAR